MKHIPITILVFLINFSPLHAEDTQLALHLGNIIASEKFCGLSYRQAKIELFIEENVSADNMSFPANLSTMIQGTRYSLKNFSSSAKTAHCTQVKRLAKSFKFID